MPKKHLGSEITEADSEIYQPSSIECAACKGKKGKWLLEHGCTRWLECKHCKAKGRKKAL